MRDYILNKKIEIKSLEVKPRFINFNPTKRLAISVIGPRRAGKTFSLFYFIQKATLKEDEYVFVNFEDEEIKSISRNELTKIVFYHKELYGKEPSYLFFDEIQSLERWESFVYSLIEKKRYKIFLTGSSSKLLSKEIATQLRGRSLTTLVLPFSFEEFLSAKNLSVRGDLLSEYEKSEIKHQLMEYLMKGGFPDVVLTNINKRLYFRDYINLVLFRDVVERFRIRNIALIRTFIGFILPSFSSLLSIQKIHNTLKSRGMQVSKKTLYKYLGALEDVFFCFLLRKFSFSERESLLSLPKIYFNDTGLVNYSISTKVEKETGKLSENLVFLELKRAENLGKISELFYWRDYQGREVDFVLKEGLRVKQLIQVTYASAIDEIDRRELRSLAKASDLLKCKDLLVITWDYEDSLNYKGKQITFVPLWKWLLNL